MNSRQTIGYFLWAGLREGAGIGILVGTLLLSAIGSIGGAFVGAVWGIALGFSIGLGVMFYNWQFLRYDTDPQTYRRRLVRAVGGLAGVITLLIPLLVYLKTQQPLRPDLPPEIWLFRLFLVSWFILPISAMAFLLFGNLAAQYADQVRVKRKNETPPPVIATYNKMLLFWANRMVDLVLKLYKQIILGLSILLVLASVVLWFNSTLPLIISLWVGWGISVLVGFWLIWLVLGVLGWLNAFVFYTLNRIYFDEYVPHLTMEQYRRRVMGIAFVITLIGSLVVTVGIGAIPSAIVAALAARDYAAWRYGETEEREKSKLEPDFA